MEVTKDSYKKCLNKTNKPIELAFVLYNVHCKKDSRIKDIGKFQVSLTVWLAHMNINILQGCIQIKNYYDQKFA